MVRPDAVVVARVVVPRAESVPSVARLDVAVITPDVLVPVVSCEPVALPKTSPVRLATVAVSEFTVACNADKTDTDVVARVVVPVTLRLLLTFRLEDVALVVVPFMILALRADKVFVAFTLPAVILLAIKLLPVALSKNIFVK